MSEEFDLAKVTEGMTADEAMEFVKSVLTPEAAQTFLDGKKSRELQERFQKESDALDKMSLPFNMRLKKLTELKAKYRRQGLRVY